MTSDLDSNDPVYNNLSLVLGLIQKPVCFPTDDTFGHVRTEGLVLKPVSVLDLVEFTN